MKRVKTVLSEVSAATYVTDNDDTTDPDSPLSTASNKVSATMNVSGPWIRCTNQPLEELLNLPKGEDKPFPCTIPRVVQGIAAPLGKPRLTLILLP
jgi:hypothetical protein